MMAGDRSATNTNVVIPVLVTGIRSCRGLRRSRLAGSPGDKPRDDNMTPAVFAIPGDIDLPTGGYMYDRRVLALLPQFGRRRRDTCSCRDRFPIRARPTSTRHGAAARRRLRQTRVRHDRRAGLRRHAGRGDRARRARPSSRSCIIRCAWRPGSPKRGRTSCARSRRPRWRWPGASSSPAATTARTLVADFAVPADRHHGGRARHRSRAARARLVGGPLQLLAVGAIVPRKAYDILVRALGPLKDRDWRLTIAGPTDRSPEALAALHAAIRDTGLGDRITLAGAVDRERAGAASTRRRTSSSCPPSTRATAWCWPRPWRAGCRSSCTTGGAAAETVPDAAAIKVPPGDERGPRRAPSQRVSHDTRRCAGRMADASWAAGAERCRAGRTRRASSPASSRRLRHERLQRANGSICASRWTIARATASSSTRWPSTSTAGGPITVVDLGCGTGSNLRATAPLLGPEQHWTLVDYEPGAARRRGRAARRLGRRRRSARTASSCCSRAPSASTSSSAAPISPAISTRALGPERQPRHGVGAVRSGVGRVHRRASRPPSPRASRPSTPCSPTTATSAGRPSTRPMRRWPRPSTPTRGATRASAPRPGPDAPDALSEAFTARRLQPCRRATAPGGSARATRP